MIQHFVVDDGSTGEREVVDQRFYCDHISKNDSRQDREAVVSMVEALLMRIKKDLPHVKKIVVQSDNAGCYQNMFLPLVFAYLSRVHGIEITRIVHTETQDGKSILDAHFACSMQIILAWIKEGHDCITPTQGVVALKGHGGLPNTVVELAEHDRTSLRLLVQEVEALEKQLRRVAKRANEIHIIQCWFVVGGKCRSE